MTLEGAEPRVRLETLMGLRWGRRFSLQGMSPARLDQAPDLEGWQTSPAGLSMASAEPSSWMTRAESSSGGYRLMVSRRRARYAEVPQGFAEGAAARARFSQRRALPASMWTNPESG